MKKFLEVIEVVGQLISGIVAFLGGFSLICEYRGECSWILVLIIEIGMLVVGLSGIFAFHDLRKTKDAIYKAFLGLNYFLANSCKRTKEFIKIVKYYRNKGYSYNYIIRLVIKCKKEVDEESKNAERESE